LKVDTDDDKLSDKQEIDLGLDPLNPDMDNDGLLDGEEINLKTDPRNPDNDRDGLLDGQEVHKYVTNPSNPDTDGDGLLDGKEIIRGTNPNNRDTDGDGIPDATDALPSVNNLFFLIPLWLTLFASFITGIVHYSYGLTPTRRIKVNEKKAYLRVCSSFLENQREIIIDLAKRQYGWINIEDVIKLGADDRIAINCLKKLGAKKNGGRYLFPKIEQSFAK